MYRTTDWFTIGFIAIVVALLGLRVGMTIKQRSTERFCLAHGYARADWRIIGESYCITRTDQTDIVVPLSKFK